MHPHGWVFREVRRVKKISKWLYDSTYITLLKIQSFRNGEQISGCQRSKGLEVEGGGCGDERAGQDRSSLNPWHPFQPPDCSVRLRVEGGTVSFTHHCPTSLTHPRDTTHGSMNPGERNKCQILWFQSHMPLLSFIPKGLGNSAPKLEF